MKDGTKNRLQQSWSSVEGVMLKSGVPFHVFWAGRQGLVLKKKPRNKDVLVEAREWVSKLHLTFGNGIIIVNLTCDVLAVSNEGET